MKTIQKHCIWIFKESKYFIFRYDQQNHLPMCIYMQMCFVKNIPEVEHKTDRKSCSETEDWINYGKSESAADWP